MNEKNITLPDSVKNLINVAQKEYDLENDRSKKLDSKGNILFVLSTTPLYYILNTLDLKQYKCLLLNKDIFIIFKIVDILLFLSICIGFAGIIYYALKVIALQTFKRIPLEDILLKLQKYKTEAEMSVYIAAKYKEIVNKNTEINNKKASFFNLAISILYIILFAFILWSLLHKMLISFL